MRFRIAVIAAVSVGLAGCATTKPQFDSQRLSMTDKQVCNVRKQARERGDGDLLAATIAESNRRGLSFDRCVELETDVGKALVNGLLVVGAVAVGAALISSARKGGGGSAPLYVPAAPVDTDWAWDEFYNEQRQLVWACRGIQTGQFADATRCTYKFKLDTQWPRKEAP